MIAENVKAITQWKPAVCVPNDREEFGANCHPYPH
jgi:hypothetical protein